MGQNVRKQQKDQKKTTNHQGNLGRKRLIKISVKLTGMQCKYVKHSLML